MLDLLPSRTGVRQDHGFAGSRKTADAADRVCFYACANSGSVVFDLQPALVPSPWQSRRLAEVRLFRRVLLSPQVQHCACSADAEISLSQLHPRLEPRKLGLNLCCSCVSFALMCMGLKSPRQINGECWGRDGFLMYGSQICTSTDAVHLLIISIRVFPLLFARFPHLNSQAFISTTYPYALQTWESVNRSNYCRFCCCWHLLLLLLFLVIVRCNKKVGHKLGHASEVAWHAGRSLFVLMGGA